MTMRALRTLGFALSVLAAMTASPPQARAATVQIDVTIDFQPPSPNTLNFLSLTGAADLFLGASTTAAATFNTGSLIPPSPIFTGHFIPGDPCVGGGTCSVSFSFAGSANDGSTNHNAYAFQTGNEAISDPGSAFTLLVGTFIPGDPCFTGGVCHASGTIFAFSTGTQVGTWDVTISEVPLPGALPLFATGLGVFGLLGWRRKRKAQAG